MTQQTKKPPRQVTLEQARAAHAWGCVEEVGPRGNEFHKKYGSLICGLPALILSDGLGMTLAFLRAKDGKAKNRGETHYIEAYNALSTWLVRELKLGVADDALLDWIVNTSTSTDYRRATAEALAWFSWLKRFTEAKGWKSDESGE